MPAPTIKSKREQSCNTWEEGRGQNILLLLEGKQVFLRNANILVWFSSVLLCRCLFPLSPSNMKNAPSRINTVQANNCCYLVFHLRTGVSLTKAQPNPKYSSQHKSSPWLRSGQGLTINAEIREHSSSCMANEGLQEHPCVQGHTALIFPPRVQQRQRQHTWSNNESTEIIHHDKTLKRCV